MSLFSTIKYPINDIYNKEQLNNIPKNIVYEWMKWCLDTLDNPNKVDIDWYNSSSKVITQIYILMLRQANHKHHNSDPIAMKQRMTDKLKQMIYESEYKKYRIVCQPAADYQECRCWEAERIINRMYKDRKLNQFVKIEEYIDLTEEDILYLTLAHNFKFIGHEEV